MGPKTKSVWRVDLSGRAVAIVHHSGLGYWLTPTPSSGVSQSTTLHESAHAVRSALALRFGAKPEHFAFCAQPESPG